MLYKTIRSTKEIEVEESCASQFHKRKQERIMLNDMEIYYTTTGEHLDEETIGNVVQTKIF